MGQVNHNPEGVVVRTKDEIYSDSLVNFVKDYGKPFPPLAGDFTQRLYEPGVRHALLVGNDVIDGGSMPWKEGDEILASIDSLIRAQTIRRAQEKKAEIEKSTAKVEVEMNAAQDGLDKAAKEEEAKVEKLRQEMNRKIAAQIEKLKNAGH
jgi:hypothetical protein